MKEIPILFSGPMMLANLRGAKDVTRRVVKPQPYYRVRTNGRGVWFWERSKSDLREFINWDGQTCEELMRAGMPEFCRYGKPGDVLWAKETWQYAGFSEEGEPAIRYAADGAIHWPEVPEEWSDRVADIWAELSHPDNFKIDGKAADRKWRPSIHMPRWARRFTAKIVSRRIERLQEIGWTDAVREGCNDPRAPVGDGPCGDPVAEYMRLWNAINGPGAWERNDWVWRIEYRNPHKEYA